MINTLISSCFILNLSISFNSRQTVLSFTFLFYSFLSFTFLSYSFLSFTFLSYSFLSFTFLQGFFLPFTSLFLFSCLFFHPLQLTSPSFYFPFTLHLKFLFSLLSCHSAVYFPFPLVSFHPSAYFPFTLRSFHRLAYFSLPLSYPFTFFKMASTLFTVFISMS